MAQAFHTLPSKLRDWRASIDGISFEDLDDQEEEKLEVPFLGEEMFSALSSLKGDKAAGLNGFSMAFG